MEVHAGKGEQTEGQEISERRILNEFGTDDQNENALDQDNL